MPSDFRILGPVQVLVDHQIVPVRAPKIRVLLGALLVHPNKAVGIDDLADRLWEGGTRRTVKSTMQTYVCRLRGLLGDANGERVVTTADGYQIQVEPDELDLLRFRTLSDQARAADDPFVQAGLLERALAQWQGRPLADVASDLMRTIDAPALEQERLEALERRFDVELRLGRHADVIGELRAITAEQPLRERFHAQLMLALYQSGRQADVFAVYRNLAHDLSAQLGVSPSPELRQLHQRVLTNHPAVAAPPKRAVVPITDVRTPRELPMGIGDFVGREKAKSQIAAQLIGPGPGAHLVVVSGQPGVGKTALAVHVAHELRNRFPGGQLYADLRGHAAASPLTPEQILPRFLISLGVPPQQVPKKLDDLVGVYRTLLADRKVLVLLDNVGTPQQVGPMLPNAPGCAVIVTSRNDLRGVTAALPITLDVLTVDQARVLLAGIIGPARVESEAAESRELGELCGHLPLALRIAAANLAARPDQSLRDYVSDLSTGNRLAALEIEGDDEAAVRAAFTLSYATLDAPEARLFRLLGLIPGPDFTAAAAAALAARSAEESTRLLDRLATANLVHRKTSTRYQLHDLLRLYAAERCRKDDTRQVVEETKNRLFHFYLRCLDTTGDLMFPTWLRMPRPVADVDLPPVEFADVAEAVSWMDHECPNVFAAIVDAADGGFREFAWPMAEALRPYLVTTGKYRAEGLAACDAALRASVRAGNIPAQAAIHNTIGAVHYRHADPTRALHHFTAELRAHRASGSVGGQARILIALGNIHNLAGNLRQAADHVTEGLGLAEAAGNEQLVRFGLLNLSFVEFCRGNLVRAEELGRRNLSSGFSADGESVTEVAVRRILGQALQLQGRLDEAYEEINRALELCGRSSAPHYEAKVLAVKASWFLDRGELVPAMEHARAAVALAVESGSPNSQVDGLIALAAVHQASGDHRQAVAHYEQASRLCRGIGVRYDEILTLIGHAESSRASGDLAAAAAGAAKALDLSVASGHRVLQGRAGTVLARTKLAAGDLDEAIVLATSAAAIANELGARSDERRALGVLDSIRGAPALPKVAP
jgi:DNA-binding SARP family transcriptional activator/tetratricopeptide (TPR) repeat protein